MRRYLQLAIILMVPLLARATNYPISAGASQSTVSSTINTAAAAGSGNTVTFAAGSYTFTSAVNIPCSNAITIQGPTANPATATITGSYTGNAFTVTGCTGGVTIQYLHTSGVGILYLQNSDQNHISILQNQCTNIQGNEQCVYIANGASCCNAPVSGVSHPLTQNMTVQFNTFGDSGSCSGQMSGDNGGNCAGMISNTTELLNVNVSYNKIIHVEEGIHFLQPANFNGTNPQAVCVNCVVDYNYLTGIHRIFIEIQNATPNLSGNSTFVEHNLITSPTNAYYGTMGLSMACCQQGFTQNVAGFAPGHTDNDNVEIDDNTPYLPCCQSGPVMADEFWGNAPIGENSLYQGQWHNGYSYGYGVTSAAAWRYNNVCGPVMASKQTPFQYNAAPFYYSQEESGGSYPTQTGNTQGSSCTTTASVSPTITPNGGSISGPTTVTLAVPITLTNIASGQNTTIYYTLDGSTPTTSSAVCNTPPATSCTVTANPGTTVKVLTMWGTSGIQPTSHPSGYGYVPSAVVSATFSSSGLYISPTGNDSNPGTLSQPWLTPNHSLNCGTTITAVSGTYSAANFQTGHWGTITCPTNNNVAWLTCQTFDTCKISSSSSDGMWVDQSYWGVQGWEITVTGGTNGACFHAGPSGSTSIHHVIFANNVANVCKGGGFNAYDRSTTASVDYIVYVGNVAYNTAGGTGACYSGLNIYQPIASDSAAGTHMYVAGNFSYANIDGPSCDSAGAGKTTDGEGINLDTFDFSQGGGPVYTQQAVVQNNIEMGNGTRGAEVENSAAGGTHAPIFIKYNTAVGSGVDPNMAFPGGIAEIGILNAFNVTVSNNLAFTVHQFTTGSNGYFALGMTNGNGTDTVNTNYASGIAGNNTYLQSSPGFTFGAGNTLGINPAFPSTATPGAPSCGSATSVPNCMASLIANLVPTASGASSYGYQTPSNTSITDPLYPQWLCSVNLPMGLVTPGCGSGAPPLTSCSQGNVGSVNTLIVGGSSVQQQGFCTYASIPTTLQCYPTPDTYGNTITSWGTSNGAILGVTGGGLASGVSPGTANVTATATGSLGCSVWGFTVNPAPPTTSTFTCTGGCKITGTFTITP